MNQQYKEYCKTELQKHPREVKDEGQYSPSRSSEVTDTLYSETFCSQPRAEFWLEDNSNHMTPGRSHVCTAIAKIGNITVMRWARQKGFPWNEQTCLEAAKNGHLEMLQCLRENGCPWNTGTCAYAASNGHLEILKWARANGCPWDEYACVCAAQNGHLELLNGPEMCHGW
ncbi:ankyrin repeat protein [Seminavis robusta]|uniref:Ankyrin repeat protein n=1 Tax=Seminavis robusta TaxID=568900 RepID=A0A9N8EZW1_9STRA|nr:ankyrin repeat protein [Seminavis robusta]|eukprot:Sro2277_g321700.1 ankyrin repeat protein (171) ;mRNA; r:3434-3946